MIQRVKRSDKRMMKSRNLSREARRSSLLRSRSKSSKRIRRNGMMM